MSSSNLENDRSSVIFEASHFEIDKCTVIYEASDFKQIPGAGAADITSTREAIQAKIGDEKGERIEFIDAGEYIRDFEVKRNIYVFPKPVDSKNLADIPAEQRDQFREYVSHALQTHLKKKPTVDINELFSNLSLINIFLVGKKKIVQFFPKTDDCEENMKNN